MYGYQYQPYSAPYVHDQRQMYQQPSQIMNQDERIWVQGRDAALAYLVAPNSFARLWDSSAPVFYEKHADATGRPYMEAYRYEKQTDSAPEMKHDEDFMEKIKALETRILALEKRGKKAVNDKSDADDSAV